jgi:MFS family permease
MKLLSDLPRNSRSCILVEPLWAIFGGMIFFYAPLYMKAAGLSEVQIGIISTLNMFISFFCHFLASPITNKMGRKKTSLIFDLISWSIPMLIWAVAQNFWFFLVAAAINAFVRIVYVSWFCLLSEDAESHQQAKVFGIINLISFGTGIFTPITGMLIARHGTIPTMRMLYFVGMLGMTLMFFLRNHFVTETRAGKELMVRHSDMTFWQGLQNYLLIIRKMLGNRQFILISLVYIIMNFIMGMNFLQVIYFTGQLQFREVSLSLIPGLSALINILLYFFLIPRLNRFSQEITLAGSFVVSVAGSILIFFIPRGNITFLLLTTSLLAVGNFIAQTYRDSVFMNKAGEHEKADMFSAVQTVTTLFCIPAGYLAGLTYSFHPLLPFAIMLGLFAAALLSAILLLLNTRKTVNHTAPIAVSSQASQQ